MRLEDIGFYTLDSRRALQASHKTPLHRCELLITSKCNFNCPYCRGVGPVEDVDLNYAKRLISAWEGLYAIRFSGGEPTLHPNLAEMVRCARRNRITWAAVSTNGSADWYVYKELIEAGVNDFSVSFDACCAGTFKEMSGGNGMFEKVCDNIRKMSERVYTTVGIVLNEANTEEAYDTIHKAMNLGVHDIRVITAAQTGKGLPSISLPVEGYHILKYRMSQDRPIRGIGEEDNDMCPLVLDDMAVQDGKHYPCIIYMREGGDPIGDVDLKMEHTRMERLQRWAAHNTHQDPICRKNCLDVCVEYNNQWGG